MPEKPLTVITYAASASLAAIALVYFFNPNYLIDGDGSSSSANTRKKSVIGLSNPANDCFINSVLQSLAGLGDLRIYLIRELHRRKLDDADVYKSLPEPREDEKPVNPHKLLSLQSGEVTQGLKVMIDNLNERPIYKKTISAAGFVAVLEHAFGTRISKAQQDAQELLQVVAERLCDEYHAGREARKRARKLATSHASLSPRQKRGLGLSISRERESSQSSTNSLPVGPSAKSEREQEEDFEEDELGFPLEGRTQSQIECQHCHFVPKSTPTSFVMLNLSVPQTSSSSLNDCFDAHFKTEFIDDYKCDRCRLEHAISVYAAELKRAKSEDARRSVQTKIDKLKRALKEDPEKPPKDVRLPDSKYAPARRIARHVSIVDFPQVLVIHLSRSIYDVRSSSAKNTAKVSFPEQMPLGGLLNRRNYKLLGVVTHKGTHNSGHYESFRRQHVYAPFSTPHLGGQTGPYSSKSNTPHISSTDTSSPTTSIKTATPTVASSTFSPAQLVAELPAEVPAELPASPISSPSLSLNSSSDRPSTSTDSTRPSSTSSPPATNQGTIVPSSKRNLFKPPSARSLPGEESSAPKNQQQAPPASSASAAIQGPGPASRPQSQSSQTPSQQPARRESFAATAQKALSLAMGDGSRVGSITGSAGGGGASKRSAKKNSNGSNKTPPDRWWRISDDKVRECKTSDVLAMQKEVYMLFYEMEKVRDPASGTTSISAHPVL